MYSEGFPKYEIANKKLTVELRDLFFYFESLTAPQTLFRDVSLSAAVSFLLDSIGFANYAFKRVAGEVDPIIPFFFIPTDKNVAEILQDLARSTQTAMFFDEYNNFICMSKSYMMPTVEERTSDFTLSKDLNIIDYQNILVGTQEVYNKTKNTVIKEIKNEFKNNYQVYGCFCSPECSSAYLMNEKIDSSVKFERYQLLNHVYGKIYDYKKNKD